MNEDLTAWAERYGKTLETYVRGAGETALKSAYEMGRMAIKSGLSCLDLAQAHHETLVRLLLSSRNQEENGRIAKLGSDFFAESLSPFEMTHRGYQEAMLSLSRRAIELEAVNARLNVEISGRERVRKALEQETSYVRLLSVATIAANMATSIEMALRVCLEEVSMQTGWRVGHVYFVDEASPESLLPSAIWYMDDPRSFAVFKKVTETSVLAKGSGLPGRVFASGKPAWVVDVTKDSNFPRAGMASDIGIRGGCAFPILAGPEVAAVLEFYTDVPRKADKPLLAVLGQIGIQLGRLVERRRSEDALRALPGRILEAQEAERRRVAHDLHDDVCQRLSATKLHIGAFESEVPKGERKLHAKLRLIKRQINLNIQEVRRIAAHLRPTTLDDMGLPVALRLLCEDFEKVNRTRAVFRMKNITPERLGSPAELTLYRIAQEGLSNVAKHAQARTVEIDLQRVNGIIRLNIADNGRGFEADRPHAESLRGYKLGLLNMKERAELLNGTCRIESAPGKGTTVVVEIPFDPEVSHAKD